MWTLSGFADEISPDLDEQVALVTQLGLRYIELRSAWDVNVLDLDPDQLQRVKTTLDAAGLGVSSIGSPIGKIAITDDNAPHLERMRHAAEVARFFDAPYIRMFSYFMPEGADVDDYRDEVISRLRKLAVIAEDGGVTLIHENEKDIFCDIPRRCLDIVEAVHSPALKLTWDNANFVQCGVRPFSEGYAMLSPHVAMKRCQDRFSSPGRIG
ncbi:MAG: TIM barrel protein [Micropruina sp.]